MHPGIWGPSHPPSGTHAPRGLRSCPSQVWHPYTQHLGVYSPPIWYPCTQGSGLLLIPHPAPIHPGVWGPAQPGSVTHVPRVLGSCSPFHLHPHTQDFGVLPTLHLAAIYPGVWHPHTQGSGAPHNPAAPACPGSSTQHPTTLDSSTPHPGFQPPTDTGADEVPSLMLGRGETPRASACSPKGAGGTQWANLTGCVGVRKPTSKRRAPSAAPLPPQLPAPNPAPPSQGTGIGQRGDLGGTYRVTVASPNPAGEAARAWWGSALPNTHRHPSGKKNTPGKRADGREKKKNKPKTPTRPPPGAAEGAALAPRLGCGQGAPSR